MTTQEVINHLYEAGLVATLQPCGSINLRPSKLVTPSIINLVKDHKQDLIKYFNEKSDPKHSPILEGEDDPLLKQLFILGNQICDYWNDSDAARAEMMADILSYPPNRREALVEALNCSLRTHQSPPKD